MDYNILITIAAGIILVVGLIGTVVPVLPGVPLAWFGLLVAFFSSYNSVSIPTLVITGIIAAAVSIADNFIPAAMTKKFGGSKYAVRGSVLGMIIGFFIGPVGLVIGPFVGALIGELIHSNGNFNASLKTAVGSFAGFLFGTGLKLITTLCFIWIYIVSFFHH